MPIVFASALRSSGKRQSCHCGRSRRTRRPYCGPYPGDLLFRARLRTARGARAGDDPTERKAGPFVEDDALSDWDGPELRACVLRMERRTRMGGTSRAPLLLRWET